MTQTLQRETIEYLKTTITSDISPSGTPRFAFTLPPARPSTWYPGAWEDDAVHLANGQYQRVARTPLIGDAAGVVLPVGRYWVFIEVTDTPEIPVEMFDHLVVE